MNSENENNKIEAADELREIADAHIHSEISTLIHDNQGKLLESEEISSAIGSSGASGFTIDVVEFRRDDIEVIESEVHVAFRFSLTGEADNPNSMADETIGGTATAIIYSDANWRVSFADIEIDDGDADCGDDDFNSRDDYE